MPVTMEQVRGALEPDEPNYAQAATLGPEAVPHLRDLIASRDPMLASKAVYLAGMIRSKESAQLLEDAASSSDPVLRVAAAGAARYLPGPAVSNVLLGLLADNDQGVRKVALSSVGDDTTPELRSQVEQLSRTEPDPRIRELATRTFRRLPSP